MIWGGGVQCIEWMSSVHWGDIMIYVGDIINALGVFHNNPDISQMH